jgi:AsmA protein
MEIKVLGSGNSMNALMNSLDGGGSFRFGAGELLGLDLVGMLRNLDTSFVGEGASTIFDEITGTFRIVDGVVINENLRMTAPLFSATGSGQVGLGGQTLNYRLVPKILQGEGAGISVPVKITGTWDSPKFGLDMAGLINENAREEIEAAKDKVEQQLKDKVQERLGTTTGQSAEDALKQKLTEEAGKGLLKLFGGN